MKDELQSCGLGDREQEILIYLLTNGPHTAGELARKLQLKRSTVYSALENLLAIRLLQKSAGKVCQFTAIPSKDIPAVLLARAQKDFEKVRVAAEMLVAPLEALADRNRMAIPGFTVDLVESSRGYGEFLRTHLGRPDCCAIWDPQIGIHNEKIKALTKEALALSAKAQNSVREIVVGGPMASWYRRAITNPLHQLHIVKSGAGMMADLVIVGRDTTAFSLNNPDREAVLVVQNRDLCAFMRGMFEYVWEATGDKQ